MQKNTFVLKSPQWENQRDRSKCTVNSKTIRTLEWLNGFNVGLEVRWWTIADCLGFIPKDNPNFDSPRRGCFLRFGTPRGIIWMGNWRSLNPRQILPAPGARRAMNPGHPVRNWRLFRLGNCGPRTQAIILARFSGLVLRSRSLIFSGLIADFYHLMIVINSICLKFMT